MKFPIFITIITLVCAMLACNYPGYGTAPNTPSVYDLPTNTQPAGTGATPPLPLSTNTPGGIPVTGPTPSVPTVFANDVGVHCRFGPGTAWAPISSIAEGDSSQIVGKNADASWWYIVDPFNDGQRCWVAASVTTTGGNLSAVPVVESPQASVTDVTVDVDPRTITTTSCSDPVSALRIAGTIEANGPTEVQWHFETQQGGAMQTQTTDFDTSGSKEFSAEYKIPGPRTPGTYWIRLIVTAPNNRQAEVSYKIECT